MGCNQSVPREPKPISTVKTFEKPKLNRLDYIFSNINNDSSNDNVVTLLERNSGSINGQQFLIEDCKNVQIHLLDQIGSMNVDNCNCLRLLIHFYLLFNDV